MARFVLLELVNFVWMRKGGLILIATFEFDVFV